MGIGVWRTCRVRRLYGEQLRERRQQTPRDRRAESEVTSCRVFHLAGPFVEGESHSRAILLRALGVNASRATTSICHTLHQCAGSIWDNPTA